MDDFEKTDSDDNDQIITDDQVFQSPTLQEIQNELPNKNTYPIYKSADKPMENTRRRHNSQPGLPFKNKNQKPRPIRSMVNMENLVYDPIQRKFISHQISADGNEHRTGLDASNLPVSAISADCINQYHDSAPKNRFENYDNNNLPDFISQYSQSQIDEYRNRMFSSTSNDTKSAGGKISNRRHKNSIGASLRSFDTLDLHSTSPEEKEKNFLGTLTTIVSCMYGVFIVTLGILLFIADIFIETRLSEFYCLYLVFVGLAYLLYLYIDIRAYTKKAHKYHEDKKKYEDYLESKDNDNLTQSEYKKQDTKFSKPISRPEPLEHPYCFSQGRHAGSFYLKLGAAAFFLGHLVHSILFLSLHVIYLTSDKDENCGSVPVLVLDIAYPLYSCMQLFFIFKYSNVIILKCKELARFVLMHCIASSLCFWVWTIIREIMESLTVYAKKSKDYPGTTTVDPDFSGEIDDYFSISRVSQDSPFRTSRALNISTLADDVCLSIHGFENIIENVNPYLYPFTIEFSILIAGIFYILWQNIGHCSKGDELIDLPEKGEWDDSKGSHDMESCKLPIPLEEYGEASNVAIHIDCHSSNRGWFFGLILMVATIVIIIMCFIAVEIYNNDKESDAVNVGAILKDVSELCLHVIMLIAALFTYYQIRQLDVNQHPISLLDDLLLFICIPAFYMEASFTVVPTAQYLSFIKFFNVVIMVLQVTVQTPLIIDALRRCSNSKHLRKLKPGRELVAFLVVCNVATWIFETFSVKNAETNDVRYEYYGKVLWTILGHVSTPLCMFYRFHSSVCLVDIWKSAYEPGNSH